MRIRPSDLYIRHESSSFAIYVDPRGPAEFYFDKKQKTLSPWPVNIGDRVLDCQSKTEAKRLIVENAF